ncbi:MAG: selenocysteine-specific translation elongation factor [Deltaproteobacteria bacterium]|jgi:selenocysteine-specific elongation factor|nr:selenocysteine-specific translation elongation factor [Deltaproteobacteria bacterium]
MATVKNRIIGTAGHVDHGKTALVLALTGVDTDRLAEEKRRGITIENGFAHLALPDGHLAGIIDVPGHERFVRHMLAGSGGVDIALLVVAADDGLMPQTREHLDILKLLGVPWGIVALTKIDLTPDPEWLELVQEEIRSLVKGAFQNEPPIIPVSAKTGQGLDDLKKTLFKALAESPAKPSGRTFRLPVDRVFTRPGFGTVVTGTVLGGSISLGDSLTVYPLGLETKARGIQVHSQTVETAYPRQRAALNLANLKTTELKRGDVLAIPLSLSPSYMLDARLALLNSSPFTLKNGRVVQVHLAASQFPAKVILMSQEELTAGQSDYAQLRLKAPIAARRGDRLVIRLTSPAITVGGGEILDPAPQKRRRHKPEVLNQYKTLDEGALRQRVELAIKERPGSFTPFSELALRADLGPKALAEAHILADKGVIVAMTPEIFIHQAEATNLTQKLKALLSLYHRENPFSPGLSLEEIRSRLAPLAPAGALLSLIALWEKSGLIVREEGVLRLKSFEPKVDESKNQFIERLTQTYLAYGFTPLATSQVLPPQTPEETRSRKAALALLTRTGELYRLDDLYHVHKTSYEAAYAVFKELAVSGPVEPGPFRDKLKTSRKVAVALLESFESRALAKKAGAGRLPL